VEYPTIREVVKTPDAYRVAKDLLDELPTLKRRRVIELLEHVIRLEHAACEMTTTSNGMAIAVGLTGLAAGAAITVAGHALRKKTQTPTEGIEP